MRLPDTASARAARSSSGAQLPAGSAQRPSGSDQRPSGSAQRRRAVRAAGQPLRVARTGAARPVGQDGRRAPADRVAELAARRGRRRSWRPGPRTVAAAAALVVLAVVAGWVLFASSWLRVETVSVTGTERTDVAAVRAIVDGELGSSLAGVDVSGLADEVSALPLVASTDVTRSWPSTLVVRVHEREAVAAVPVTAGGVDLVDDRGRVLVHADAPPSGVPLVSVDVDAAGADALLAALAVNGSLPAALRSQVAGISATSSEAVRLRLLDGPEVVWGGVDRPQRKAEVLERLLAAPDVAGAQRIDVSAPDAAAVAS